MKPRVRFFLLVAAACALFLCLSWIIFSAPRPPVALIHVVDAAGHPVAGAVVTPDGLRPKPGRVGSGHYRWNAKTEGVANDPVMTDPSGVARVPYPRYVTERIETGEISFSVSHPDFVPDRPFRTVTTAPPKGAPWRIYVDYIWNRIRRKELVVRPAPVVLQRGVILRLTASSNPALSKDAPLFAQISRTSDRETNFWIHPEPGVIVTRRLAPGPQAVRAVQFDEKGAAWFSEVLNVAGVAEELTELSVELKPGLAVRGMLDDTVPRPVTNGRVVAHVWPRGHRQQDRPPEWHAWRAIREDGTFEFNSLPEGDLELVALCHGYVSETGPGQSSLRTPQKHPIGTNGLSVTIRMEPTARLEVQVFDNRGQPLKDAKVSTWPNVRYGDWVSTVLASDCYNTEDRLLSKPIGEPNMGWWQPVPDFVGITGEDGLAVLPNLPADVKMFMVEHAQFALPIIESPGGDKNRFAPVRLTPSQTNRVSVKMEPRGKDLIGHF